MDEAPKIDVWNDSRVQKRSANCNGKTIGFLYGEPQGERRADIFLLHGFPDLSMGWRYQIPMLLKLGLRVVAPDCTGYGRTDAPAFTLKDYSYKSISDDVEELARQLGCSKIILGGHDFGGAIVYRMAMYKPHLVSDIFSIGTPYFAPSPSYVSLGPITKKIMPSFQYQLQFASGELEERIRSKNEIRMFLNAIFGGVGAGGERGFDPTNGVLFDNLPKLQANNLLSERELDYYVDEFCRHGIHGPLNYYRARETNYLDELEQFFEDGKVEVEQPRIEQNCLFVALKKDAVLTPELAAGMGQNFSRLVKEEVDATHWGLWEKPDEVNNVLANWLETAISSKVTSD